MLITNKKDVYILQLYFSIIYAVCVFKNAIGMSSTYRYRYIINIKGAPLIA